MHRTVFVVTSFLLLSCALSSGTIHESSAAQSEVTPLAPQAGTEESVSSSGTSTASADAGEQVSSQPFVAPPARAQASSLMGPDYPAEVSIPSIQLSDTVVRVGVTADGAMDVPDGKTSDIGWYENGTVPGTSGSAVMDAHVFAAFKNLRYVKIGQSVYATMASGRKLHYVVTASMLYPYQSVPLDLVFNRSDGSYLNFITCAGHLTPDHSTYTERLVVYAKLLN